MVEETTAWYPLRGYPPPKKKCHIHLKLPLGNFRNESKLSQTFWVSWRFVNFGASSSRLGNNKLPSRSTTSRFRSKLIEVSTQAHGKCNCRLPGILHHLGSLMPQNFTQDSINSRKSALRGDKFDPLRSRPNLSDPPDLPRL